MTDLQHKWWLVWLIFMWNGYVNDTQLLALALGWDNLQLSHSPAVALVPNLGPILCDEQIPIVVLVDQEGSSKNGGLSGNSLYGIDTWIILTFVALDLGWDNLHVSRSPVITLVFSLGPILSDEQIPIVLLIDQEGSRKNGGLSGNSLYGITWIILTS